MRALNKQYVLNNHMCLTTSKYGMTPDSRKARKPIITFVNMTKSLYWKFINLIKSKESGFISQKKFKQML